MCKFRCESRSCSEEVCCHERMIAWCAKFDRLMHKIIALTAMILVLGLGPAKGQTVRPVEVLPPCPITPVPPPANPGARVGLSPTLPAPARPFAAPPIAVVPGQPPAPVQAKKNQPKKMLVLCARKQREPTNDVRDRVLQRGQSRSTRPTAELAALTCAPPTLDIDSRVRHQNL